MWRLAVSDACIGSGSCVGLAPAYFALGENGKSHPLTVLVDPDETLLDAAYSCPMEAISVEEADTGEAVEP